MGSDEEGLAAPGRGRRQHGVGGVGQWRREQRRVY
eukprot:COSAG01_NODE_59368_length_300_cov_1.636816_1_plen_34_part_01